MRVLPLAALAVLAAGAAAMLPQAARAGDEAAKPVGFRAEAKVTLDAAGHPVAIEPSEDLPAPIRDFIRQRVATWHFSPPEQDGVTGPAVTYLLLGACALPDADGNYRLGVDLKANGPRYSTGPQMIPPDYPMDARIHQVEARADVRFIVGTDGRATLEEIVYADGGKHRRYGIDQSLRDWVAGMRYDPEQLAGRPVRTRMSVPVTFVMGDAPFDSEAFREKQRERVAKSEECRLAAGGTSQGLQPVALNSPVRIEPAG